MGYYSKFELKEPSGGQSRIDILNEIEHVVGYDVFEDIVKWYDFKKCMEQVSKIYSDIYIVLKREGEENMDIEELHLFNGKSKSDVPVLIWSDPDAIKNSLGIPTKKELMKKELNRIKTVFDTL